MLFVFIGFLLLTGGYFFYRKNQRWVRAAQRTSGQVLHLAKKTDKDQDGRPTWFWFATIGFSLGGQSYQFRDAGSVNPKIYAVGTTHPVLYNPQNPADARLVRS